MASILVDTQCLPSFPHLDLTHTPHRGADMGRVPLYNRLLSMLLIIRIKFIVHEQLGKIAMLNCHYS